MGRTSATVILLLIGLQPGCGRVAKALPMLKKSSTAKLTTAAKNAVPKTVPAAPSALKYAPSAAPGAAKILPEASRGMQSAARLESRIAWSRGIGTRLTALHGKIPVHVYARLWDDWQRRHAQLESYERQLQDPSLPSDRRARLEARRAEESRALSEIEAEIERQARIYG